MCALPSGAEPHAPPRLTVRGHESAAEEALQVNHEVETSLAHFLKKAAMAAQGGERAGRRGTAIKGQDCIEIRMATQQFRIATVHYPGNIRLGEALPECCQDGKGVNDVAQRTGLD